MHGYRHARRARRRIFSVVASAGLLAGSAVFVAAPASTAVAADHARIWCEWNAPNCTELLNPDSIAPYTGHDEPSLLFYSDRAGSGNSSVYRLVLPTDPPVLPNQSGTGGTFNFQLRPAFWFGMAMCDTQSAPNPGAACTPDSDTNIYNGTDPSQPDYIGNHPGTAFMEMQFYPPGWAPWPAGDSCDATQWCAALNIDSYSQDMNTGATQNETCASLVGLEYVNFAFITKSGAAQAPANPLDSTLATYTPDPTQDLFMSSGDVLTVDMHDTSAGFQVDIHDQTSGATGSMTASPDNGFAQIQFDPTGSSCNALPYAFHPMYSTSSEQTRVPWAAHSYNVSFSDEIGHFEYCSSVDNGLNCNGTNANEASLDGDDYYCLPASMSTRIQIGGCLGTDLDFDGVPYQAASWPGTNTNPGASHRYAPTPVRFSSPTFGGGQQYSRVGFENDLPRIELATSPACDRTTGTDCVDPPAGAFYPIFTTRGAGHGCMWQLGGANIPGTSNTFGGTAAAEYGPLLQLAYPSSVGNPPTPAALLRYNDFRNVLPDNPCQS